MITEIIIFEKLRISRVIPRKSLSFPETVRVQDTSEITKKKQFSRNDFSNHFVSEVLAFWSLGPKSQQVRKVLRADKF